MHRYFFSVIVVFRENVVLTDTGRHSFKVRGDEAQTQGLGVSRASHPVRSPPSTACISTYLASTLRASDTPTNTSTYTETSTCAHIRFECCVMSPSSRFREVD